MSADDTEESSASALAEAFPESADRLRDYVALLGSRGLEWGLLGPREGDKLWSRHISNSLALVDLLPEGVDVADIGSGAGLPGIPLALARPDVRVTLIESLARRVRFLELAVDELGLEDRVEVVRGRAEEQKKRVFDVVTARAVAPLERLVRWTTPLFLPRGELLALKGETAADEIREARKVLATSRLHAELLEVRAAPGLEGTRVVRIRRGN